ncbi:tetratricopeptide repeat protein, partial [Turicibacter sanguinis]|nr:tetratricopeptide repeat protein [Turicibacter sanguinis]
ENGLYDDHFTWDLAIAYLELEEYDEAKACFEQGATLFADNVEFLFDYAQFLIEEGLSNEAIKLLERILQLDPSATPARELLENLM